MKIMWGRQHFTMLAVLVVLLGVLSSTSVLGQTTQSAPAEEMRGCDESLSPGRPTLRRRAPQEGSSSTQTIVDEKNLVKCGDLQNGTTQNAVSIRFVGLTSFHESDVLKHFREERANLNLDLMPNAETTDEAAAVLKKLLSTKGYVFADVNVIRDEQFSSVTFQVTEGQRLPLADIRFEGTKVFSNAELATVMRECLSKWGESENAYDQQLLEYCLRNTANFLKSRGYLQAQLGEPKREIIGNRIIVNVAVDEGLLYRLGKITIEGADHLLAEDIRLMLPLSQGEVADPEKISKWLYEDLKKSYGDLGYIEYTAEPVPEFRKGSEAEGVVDFKVIIEEGDRFKLRSLDFVGQHLPIDQLLNESPLRPGDVYNQSVFANFINKLNQSGLFEPIDKDKDADFRVNEEERLIGIRLTLKRHTEP